MIFIRKQRMFYILQQLLYMSALFGIIPQQCYGRLHQGTHYCESYGPAPCPSGKCEFAVEDCSLVADDEKKTFDEPNNYMHCYAVWLYRNGSTTPILSRKGCWLNHDSCASVSECVSHETEKAAFFCCCDGNMCNKEFFHRPRNQTKVTKVSDPSESKVQDYQLSKTILCSIVPIIGVAFLIVTFYFMWRHHKRHLGHHQLPTMDPNLVHTPTEASFSIQLLEQKAKGRFGFVWKAKMIDQFVAVKIFPVADKKSFSSEVDIYRHANMSHENILQFIGAEVKEENSYTEYFLITEYHERGSLFDFLKANTITWAQLCRIGETMASGLSYLHDEIPGAYKQPQKPAIAHRDFKSKNVLIKSDLSACIADFGLALAFYPNMCVNETHTQVGTRRYMAPEVLEGAICFNMDSFLRIDMYACSLVLWELMTRCTCVEDVIDDYRLPFEAEVGLQPTLEEMQPLVAGQKRRPIIKPAWYQSPGMASLVTTMEECWDQDAEARLSAGCVFDRIAQLSRTINTADRDNNSAAITQPSSTPVRPFSNLTNSHNNPIMPHAPQPPSSPALNNNNRQAPQHQPRPPYVPHPPPSSTPTTGNSNSLQIYYQQW